MFVDNLYQLFVYNVLRVAYQILVDNLNKMFVTALYALLVMVGIVRIKY